MSRHTLAIALALLVVSVLSSAAPHAQWLKFVRPGTPRTPDGRPNLAAAVPRALDGHPDLSGVWMHELTTETEMRRLFGPAIDDAIKVQGQGMEIGTQHKYAINILLDVPSGESLLLPEARDTMRRRASERNPTSVCVGSPGLPRAGLLSEPFKIVQSPLETIVLYEAGNSHRQIYTDGRRLPENIEFPSYFGYSVGRWDGDSLLVDTVGFNEKTTFDALGHPHSDALHVTERFHRRDFGHLDIEMTFDDSRMYTKAFTIRVPHDLLADADVFESYCDNEKDRAHLGPR